VEVDRLPPVALVGLQQVEAGDGQVAGVQHEGGVAVEGVEVLAVVEADPPVAADLEGEHVLHPDDHAGPRRVLGEALGHPPAVPTLPSVRGVDDDQRDPDGLRHLHAPQDLLDGIGAPDAAGHEQEGRVDRLDLEVELPRQLQHGLPVLGGRVLGHHHLDGLVAGGARVPERLTQRLPEERGCREEQLRWCVHAFPSDRSDGIVRSPP
jgi:hypothetical protein